jgi:signal transduction histidine kinase
MLALQDIAERHPIEKRRVQAMVDLADMYIEWDGQRENAVSWLERLYDHYKKINQPNQLLMIVAWSSILNAELGKKEQAIKYLQEEEKLSDSLQVFGFYKYYLLYYKRDFGLITYRQYLHTLDDLFGSRRFVDVQKAYFHLNETGNLDSLRYYMVRAKKSGEDVNQLEETYFFQTKNYTKYIAMLKEDEKKSKQGDLAADLLGSYWYLSRAYELIKQYKPAFEYFKRAHQLNDSINKLKDEVGVATLSLQKQAEIKQAKFDEQNKIQAEELKRIALRNRIRLYTFFSGVAILLLIAFILWRSNIRKQKDKLKIEKAYHELKSTQTKLIQSEKMASLGELTAGIAHEIQNPLNFVNNFSDVNKELVDELQQELKAGKVDDAIAISNDIKDNEQKINHHGKRADAIVKNMLQHSRSSSGKKEATDINALADEYLRLAYHGLRAKDKSFNAITKTDFDNSIGKINIIPQDIGRVVLNLINNAFYAVDEKKKQSQNGYEPAVSVSTKTFNGKVEISVKDNGNGISQKILDKIFQPFFTTKPTGQGTGLGLSLSYDIVKAHGGELKLETREGEGSEFIIQLPKI